MTIKNETVYKYIALTFVIFMMMYLASCTKKTEVKNTEIKGSIVVSSDTTLPEVSLSWEKDHSERKEWSKELLSQIENNKTLFLEAKDFSAICPKISLPEDKKKLALAEFFVAVVLHESGFKPESSSVDVGKKEDLESYSVGLFQMSGNDSSAKKFNAKYSDLKNPIINIKVAMEQFRKQISKEGLFLLPNKSPMRYWAVILVGNKYNKIDINKRMKDKASYCF
jgi:hypothetical protein